MLLQSSTVEHPASLYRELSFARVWDGRRGIPRAVSLSREQTEVVSAAETGAGVGAETGVAFAAGAGWA